MVTPAFEHAASNVNATDSRDLQSKPRIADARGGDLELVSGRFIYAKPKEP